MFDRFAAGVLRTCNRALGTQVTFEPAAGGQYLNLLGVFNNEFVSINAENGAEVISSEPNLGIQLSDWPLEPNYGDTIIINSVTYLVRHLEKDGQGGATILLDKS